jgi:sphingolipid delta-4 desaturase
MAKRDFIWQLNTQEPHHARRIEILKKYPDVKSLFGPDPNSKWISLLLISTQLWLSVTLQHAHWLLYLPVMYMVGATITQALFLAVHETSHNLMFKGACANRWFSIILNLPIVFPFSIAFRHYHLDHHKHQGVDGVDMDLPTNLERNVIGSRFSKFIWITFQIVMYAMRPVIYGTNQLKWSHILAWNIAIQLVFNAIVWKLWGSGPLIYLSFCVLIAGGVHPCAGHFLSEHYALDSNPLKQVQETFSYYGPLNLITWNVGYHNEHHDFPYVSGSRLPLLYKMAPEFYGSLVICDSWVHIIYSYIMTPNFGPHCRIKRL